MPWIKVNAEVKKLLAQKSKKTGLSEYDLANNFLSDALKENEDGLGTRIGPEEIEDQLASFFGELIEEPEPNPGMTREEMEALLDHDCPEGDWVSEKLQGLAHCKTVSDAVEVKNRNRIRDNH